ncbi:MAG: hypothetical protein ACWGMY_08945, partial [Hyphomicrobiaceae bacterium]
MSIRLPRTLRAGFASLALVSALSACGPSGGKVQSASAAAAPRPAIRQPVHRVPRDPQFQMMPGLEGVIGASEDQLVRQFGPARLDVWEGDARKLQFTGEPCILDIYLYPTSRSNEPLATYVDARRASDGQDVDRAACVRALK